MLIPARQAKTSASVAVVIGCHQDLPYSPASLIHQRKSAFDHTLRASTISDCLHQQVPYDPAPIE